jgi:hypothetical protein
VKVRSSAAPTIAAASNLLSAQHLLALLHPYTPLTKVSVQRELAIVVIQDDVVAEAMWIDTLVDASIFREWIANIGRRNAHTRIAHLLCEFALRLKHAGLAQQQDHYEIPMSQEQLADATGLTPVHVNRTIMALQAEGLITRSTPRSISIRNWAKLAQAGDFDSDYLHLHPQQATFA